MSGTKQKSRSVSQPGPSAAVRARPADSRAARTREQIDSAFVMLLHRRSYDNMRVSDIARKAGVGRATFYAHFISKDDLLRSQLQRVVLPMLRLQPEEPFLLDCRMFFEHIRTAPHIYKALMGGRERNGARVIREALNNTLKAH
jgi:AcrR family transcriptional regulator